MVVVGRGGLGSVLPQELLGVFNRSRVGDGVGRLGEFSQSLVGKNSSAGRQKIGVGLLKLGVEVVNHLLKLLDVLLNLSLLLLHGIDVDTHRGHV